MNLLDSELVVGALRKRGYELTDSVSRADVVLFNTHTMHMALANNSQHVRKSLIYSYSHFWVKGTVSGVPKDLGRVATTPQRLRTPIARTARRPSPSTN